MSHILHVFADESGDVGFSSTSSRHFIVAVISVSDPLAVRRLVRKAHARFGPRVNRLCELKSSKASDGLRQYMLEGIAHLDVRIAWSAVYKPGLPHRRHVDKEALATSLFADAFCGIARDIVADEVRVVVDRRQRSGDAKRSFDRTIQETITSHHAGYFVPEITISHLDSQKSACLQAADIVAGTVFRSLERGEKRLIAAIEPMVAYEKIFGQ